MRNPEIGKSAWQFFCLLREMHVVLAYQGVFDQEMVKSFLKMTENKLQEEQVEDTTRRKLFIVLVEALQNICKHQQGADGKETNSIFLLGRDDENYYVFTGNQFPSDKTDIIRSKIDLINSMDKDGLKSLYKNARLQSEISEAGGAGLGFIDMARKSGNKLEYSFETVTDGISFFTLLTTITISGK